MRFIRPPQSKKFKSCSAFRRERVREAIEQGRKPPWGDRPLWSKLDVKEAFLKAQFKKCGYCEASVVNINQSIDHFYPKGAIRWRMLKGMSQSELELPIGFWWRAFDWDNYILACEYCNRAKSCYFPVVEGLEGPMPDIPRQLEQALQFRVTPLLLNPYEPFTPSEHFDYPGLGMLVGVTREGLETIAICDLAAERLNEARASTATRASNLATEYLMAKTDQARSDALNELHELGLEDRSWSGMVRIIWERSILMSWEELGETVKALSVTASSLSASSQNEPVES